jgi:heme A synthase
MVPWQKRLVYLFVSVLLGTTLVSILSLFFTGTSPDPFAAFFAFEWFTLFLSLFGLLIGIPVVLAWRDFEGWRSWAFLGLGICIGPFTLLLIQACFAAWMVISSGGKYSVTEGYGNFIGTAAAVYGLSTLAYLLLLRYGEVRTVR